MGKIIKRTIIIKLEYPAIQNRMQGSWATAHTDKPPTKKEIKSECESWLSDLGFSVKKTTILNNT